MSQRIGFKIPGAVKYHVASGESLSFTLPGLKKWLNEVEIREGYVEGEYGVEVEIPLGLALRYAKNATVEVISE